MNRIFLLVPLLLLTGCGGANWGWYIIDPTTTTGWNNLKFLASGAYWTIALSLTAICFSVVIGLLIALPACRNTAAGAESIAPMSSWSVLFRSSCLFCGFGIGCLSCRAST